ncbi:MAG: hypothetical protein WCF84_03185 [Anaerolineae bacterium]
MNTPTPADPILIGSYRLSPEFFVKTRLVNRCKTDCAEQCCTEGCFITIHDARRVIKHREEIQPYLVEPFDFDSWDVSRPANICTPVRAEGTPHQQCWFLTQDKCCSLHTLAIDKGVPVPSIKPYFCLMFPLTLMDIDINVNEIAVDNKAYSTCLVEGSRETYLYQQFETELKQYIGAEAYAEIERRFPPC